MTAIFCHHPGTGTSCSQRTFSERRVFVSSQLWALRTRCCQGSLCRNVKEDSERYMEQVLPSRPAKSPFAVRRRGLWLEGFGRVVHRNYRMGLEPRGSCKERKRSHLRADSMRIKSPELEASGGDTGYANGFQTTHLRHKLPESSYYDAIHSPSQITDLKLPIPAVRSRHRSQSIGGAVRQMRLSLLLAWSPFAHLTPADDRLRGTPYAGIGFLGP